MEKSKIPVTFEKKSKNMIKSMTMGLVLYLHCLPVAFRQIHHNKNVKSHQMFQLDG